MTRWNSRWHRLIPLLAVIVVAIWLPAKASAQAGKAWFVILNTSTNPSATVTVAPAGKTYSAAATSNTGTIWNQLPFVADTLNPAGKIGNPSTNSDVGTYRLYASPKALVDSTGSASAATLDVAIDYVSNTGRGITAVTQANTNPQAVFGTVWRQTVGTNSVTYTVANLPAANAPYDLYFYAANNSTTPRGATITLAAANIPAGETGTAATAGISGTVTIFDGSGNIINQGKTWNVVRAVADSSARIVFTQSKISSGQNWCSGFQLVRRPWPPSISVQPLGALTTYRPGATTISVVAAGDDPLTYQWRRNGVAVANGPTSSGSIISGATTATLHFENTQDADAGSYDVVITNSVGTVTSSACALTVQYGLLFSPAPASQITAAGGSATFSATVVGQGPITYQWYFGSSPLANGTLSDGTIVSGVGTTTLVLSNIAAARAGDYMLKATNSQMIVTSPVASLSIVPFTGPSIPSTLFQASSYGAVADGVTDNAAAIQAAINAASSAGGGTVLVPAGTLMCGPLTLKSKVHLRFADGSTIKLLPYGQWPNYPYSASGTPSFITADTVSDVMISGTALIDGQGQAWWDHYEGTNGVPQQTTNRPGSLISFSHVTRGAIIGISTLNPPNQHFGISNLTSNLVISRCSLTAPNSAPNTDGINMAGQNVFIERCSISTGDDNIVIKAGSSNGLSSDIRITNCYFGTGHGCSMGSFTNNPGIRNVVADNLVFEGTDAGINLKSNPTRGNVVENLSYSNITMHNVAAPFGIQSYYGTVGYPGSAGSYGAYPTGTWSNTAEKYNATPPTPLNVPNLLPQWRNITISDVTISGSTDFSVLWGVPNMPVRNVTFRNITQTGGPGFRIYNADNIVFAGNNQFQIDGHPLVTSYNANILTSVPGARMAHPGDAVSFTVAAAGSSGVSNIFPTYAWKKGSALLANGSQADGSVVSGATTSTLTITGVTAATAGTYTAVVSNTLDTYVYSNPSDATTGALVPAGQSAQATYSTTLGVYPSTYTLQPKDALSTAGGTAVFTVTAPIATALRWQMSTDNGATYTDLPGATSSTLVLNNVTAGALYRAVATTSNGEIPSNSARLALVSASHFTTTPTVNFAYRTPIRSGITVSGSAAIGSSASVWNNLTGATPNSSLKTQTLLNGASLVSDSGTASGLALTLSASSVSNTMDTVVKAYNDSSTYGPITSIFDYYTYYWYTSALTVSLSGLKPGGMYQLYGYGVGNSVGQGSTWTMSAANGGASGAVLADFDKGYSRSASAANAGHSYAKISGQASASGVLTVYVSPNPGGNDPYFNGLQLAEIPSAAITGQPGSVTSYSGSTASFTVSAPTASAFLWQYSSNGGTSYTSLNPVTIPSAATATLQLSSLQSSQAGRYRAIVLGADGAIVVSNAAVLTVNASSLPVFQTQPTSQTVNPGQSVTFTASATAVPNPTYQWQKNNVLVVGATSSSYTIPSATGADRADYKVEATNPAGVATSNTVTLRFSNPQDDYMAKYGLDPATTGAPTADPDNDGISNRLEFFLGGNPTKADNNIQPVTRYVSANGSQALVFEFNRNKVAAATAFTVEYTTDLTGTWTTAVDGQNGITIATTVLDANTDHITLTIPYSGAKLFAKLRF